MSQNFILEIGTEDLPSKNLRSLAEVLTINLKKKLKSMHIDYGNVVWYATSRRLALRIINLAEYQKDFEIKNKGPSFKEAFDILGKPSKIAKLWAAKCGIDINEAKYLVTTEGKWLFHCYNNKGKKTDTLLFSIISNLLSKLQNQKLMYWGNNNFNFIRPITTLVMMIDDQIINGELFGICSNRIINGHRFMCKSRLIIDNSCNYVKILKNFGKVIVDYEERKKKIRDKINKIVKNIDGIVDLSDSLLEEVTSLVEWPSVLIGKFEKKFLNIPHEILIYIIKIIYKCFLIYDHKNNLLPIFIFVVNIKSAMSEKIISDYEKVITTRLNDIEFFLKIDSAKPLINYLPLLKTITFHKYLGTLNDKTNRLISLIKIVSVQIGADIAFSIRAALLSKCDLLTKVVFEFPDMQGIMGMYYAKNHEHNDVALAIKEQYYPKFLKDNCLPSNHIASALSIVDKIDTIVGICGINQQPTGSKDPFGLRRAVSGILRIIIYNKYNIDLFFLVKTTVALYNNILFNKNVINDTMNYILSRICSFYKKLGYDLNIIKAVLACNVTKPLDFDLRVKALSYFCRLNIANEFIQINKRILNILKKFPYDFNDKIDRALLTEKEEIKLVDYFMVLKTKFIVLLDNKNYQTGLLELTTIIAFVNEFLNNVIVMDMNSAIRINRLTLLYLIRSLFLTIADMTLLY